LTAATQGDGSDKSTSIMSFLKHFNQNRHHVTNPEGKQKARDFIEKTFQDLGLVTWREEFEPDFPQFATGVNLVGKLPGTLAGSRNDRLFLIGAHYDTIRTTSHGADDNGSGVAAMLQVAKQITTDFSKCARSFSVLFVAFDFEEWEDCSDKTLNPRCACGQIDCGSRAFVANFSRFYNGSLHSNGKLQGAIIMDTVMNYNNTPNTQALPASVDKAFPEIFNQIKEDKFRGNFLSVAGRLVDDAALMDSFWYHYNQVESALNNKTTMYAVNLPFYGQPSQLPYYMWNAMGDFLRSDHLAFWNNFPSLSAIFLSDTADHRGYMVSCYHANCDNIARVTPEMLQFLQKTSDTILATTNDVTKVSCPGKREGLVVSQTGNCMSNWKVALVGIGTLLLGVLITAAAFVLYLRLATKDDTLVTRDHLQSSFNADNSGKVI